MHRLESIAVCCSVLKYCCLLVCFVFMLFRSGTSKRTPLGAGRGSIQKAEWAPSQKTGRESQRKRAESDNALGVRKRERPASQKAEWDESEALQPA